MSIYKIFQNPKLFKQPFFGLKRDLNKIKSLYFFGEKTFN